MKSFKEYITEDISGPTMAQMQSALDANIKGMTWREAIRKVEDQFKVRLTVRSDGRIIHHQVYEDADIGLQVTDVTEVK